MTTPLHVAFMWHMHQPYYRDDTTNTFLLPWVRLRCAKDYLKMAAILDGYPKIHQTINLVPSLVEQIQAYASRDFSDTYLEMSRRPVKDLAEDERAFIARWMTESTGIPRVRQFARYLELVSKREREGRAPSTSTLAQLFDDQELLDLQVWFNLAWIGPETVSAKAELAELVMRGRHFVEEDKDVVFRAQLEAIDAVLPAYRGLQERGQAELVTSPYFHPIMPLVADLRVAQESHPDLPLPQRPYRHPDDIEEHLRLAVDAHERTFGKRPKGLWPPEAALSDDVLSAIAKRGIEWAVTDEAILAHSLQISLDRDGQGVLFDPDVLYRPYRRSHADGSLELLFRDARLSNLIGFEYHGYEAQHAAEDLVGRLLAIQSRLSHGSGPRLVTIALDGENCWDFYPENGNSFLHALYQRLEREPLLKTVTVSEFLESYAEAPALDHVYPGSWIDANLDTWVGDQEHNQAWEMLEEAREAIGNVKPSTKVARAARRELLIAEGSDWFWWFGRTHDSGMDAVWDNLFRLHLRNAYHAAGKTAPGRLYQAVAKQPESRASKAPERKISPSLNGHLDEAEWQAAGYFDASALFGAMHPPKGLVKRIWFGHDDEKLYVRLDLRQQGAPRELDVHLAGDGGEGKQTLRMREDADGWKLRIAGREGRSNAPRWESRAAPGDRPAFGIPFEVVKQAPGDTLHLSLSARTPFGLEQLPPAGSLKIRVPGEISGARDRPLKILLVSAEVAPFAKVGGLADVAGALPKALRALGHDVRVVMPRYGSIDRERYQFRRVLRGLPVRLAQQSIEAEVVEGRIGEQVPLYLIENEQLFGREGMYGFWDDDARFIYFSRAALQMLEALGFQPDVIHVNDWHTAIVPNMLEKLYRANSFYGPIATVLTIHNLAFQGVFGYGALHLANLDPWGLIKSGIAGLDEQVNLLARGLYFADLVNTVSRRYADEILTPEFGEGMDALLRMFKHKLHGIINGIDYEVFNPSVDRAIVARYDIESLERKVENKLALQREVGLPEDPAVPVIGLISRLYDQKGLDLLANIMWGLMRLNLQLVVLGAGEPRYEEMFRVAAHDNAQKISATIGFKPVLAQHIYAGSDMFLMPSRFEPCGLGQLISLRYGTIPIVRATGGLADTIADWDPSAKTGNGFVFSAYDHWDLYAQVVRALENYRQRSLWRKLQHNAMSTDVSWKRSAEEYVALYRSAVRSRREASDYVALASATDPW